MKKVISRLAVGIGIMLAVVVVVVLGIRLFSDGPVVILPGGPMLGSTSHESFPGFGDRSSDFIELQVEGWRPSSRTVIGFLHDQELYMPSVRAESKWWPHQVLDNPEVIVRYQGLLYPRKASLVTDGALIRELRQATANVDTLVSTPEMFKADTTWFFRLDHIID